MLAVIIQNCKEFIKPIRHYHTKNKIMNHATNNSISSKSFCLPRLAFHISARGQNSEAPLTKAEERLHKILSQTRGETLIAISIRARISGGSIRSFREMIVELKDQLNDCGKTRMIEVIGSDAVDLLEVL